MPIIALSFSFFLLMSQLAFAHPFHDGNVGFTEGFFHPIHGLDHILAMVAVGLWAAQAGGRKTYLIPASFVSVMAVGAMLGMAGIAIPGTEAGILASVLILGLLVATATNLRTTASMVLVGSFALFHGNAHGLEMPKTLSAAAYFLGFVLATAFLHGIGIATANLLMRTATLRPRLVQIIGGAIAAYSFVLWQ